MCVQARSDDAVATMRTREEGRGSLEADPAVGPAGDAVTCTIIDASRRVSVFRKRPVACEEELYGLPWTYSIIVPGQEKGNNARTREIGSSAKFEELLGDQSRGSVI